jgi:hypothetical protein
MNTEVSDKLNQNKTGEFPNVVVVVNVLVKWVQYSIDHFVYRRNDMQPEFTAKFIISILRAPIPVAALSNA